jgi:hypothetical protein
VLELACEDAAPIANKPAATRNALDKDRMGEVLLMYLLRGKRIFVHVLHLGAASYFQRECAVPMVHTYRRGLGWAWARGDMATPHLLSK